VLSENVTACDEILREIFVTVQEHFIFNCGCREAVKVFRFLLSPYSLIRTCNNVQNSHCPSEMAEGGGVRPGNCSVPKTLLTSLRFIVISSSHKCLCLPSNLLLSCYSY
jgi:hypothetical protein